MCVGLAWHPTTLGALLREKQQRHTDGQNAQSGMEAGDTLQVTTSPDPDPCVSLPSSFCSHACLCPRCVRLTFQLLSRETLRGLAGPPQAVAAGQRSQALTSLLKVILLILYT